MDANSYDFAIRSSSKTSADELIHKLKKLKEKPFERLPSVVVPKYFLEQKQENKSGKRQQNSKEKQSFKGKNITAENATENVTKLNTENNKRRPVLKKIDSSKHMEVSAKRVVGSGANENSKPQREEKVSTEGDFEIGRNAH